MIGGRDPAPDIDLLLEDEQISRLSAEVREAVAGSAGTTVRAEVSATLRPALIAAMLEDDFGLEDRPALIVTPDDRSARRWPPRWGHSSVTAWFAPTLPAAPAMPRR